MGPVDYVLVEWPGRQPNGEAAPTLIDLVDRGLIRIIDLAFIAKGEDGSVAALEIADLGGVVAEFAVFEGAASGLIHDDDIGRAPETLEAITTIPQGGTGDVKYHHGAQGTYQLPNGESILVNLESNPSHLRVRVARRRGRYASRADHAPGPARAPGHQCGDPDHHPRRRRLPRAGSRRRDARPPGPRRLQGRRLAAP